VKTGKYALLIIIFILFALIIGWVGFSYLWHSPDPADAKTDEKAEQADTNAVAKVKIVPVQLTTMNKMVTAYGNVVVAPEFTRVSAVSFESKVSRVMVTPGQMVASGAVLMEVEPSPEAMMQLDEAKNAQKTAAMEVEQVKKRLDLKLGTNQELIQAQNTLELAQAKLANLERRGTGNVQVTAQVDGLVSQINAQPGQIIPAGSPLVQIAASDKLEVLLGVEPADAAHLQTGLSVEIRNVNAPEPNCITGQIRQVSQRINPTTRLVDVIVTMPPKCPLMLDTYVSGKIIVGSKQALVVPRSAVLIDGEHYNVFTVKDGRAVKVTLSVGLENNSQVEVITDQLKADDPVVVEGNYELEDGMAVNTEDAR
jgi:membrane fusion protein, multidrug efflux system